MIDNIQIIKPLLRFEQPGDFFMLYVLKRKKDMPAEERDNHQSVRTIKSYCVDSVEYLERRYDEIRLLCETFKARAYIHVQRQNHLQVSLEMLAALALRIKDGCHRQKDLFDSVVGSVKTAEKRWVVDIDSRDPALAEEVSEFIDGLRPEGPKIIAIIPTKNGFHLITERFDALEFKRKHPGIDIQKKNPTLLYLPSSLD